MTLSLVRVLLQNEIEINVVLVTLKFVYFVIHIIANIITIFRNNRRIMK